MPGYQFVYSVLYISQGIVAGQRLDNIIRLINRFPVDRCWQNKLWYPLDSELSGLKHVIIYTVSNRAQDYIC